MLLSKFLVSKKILQKLGVRKDILDEKDMARLLDVEDIIIHDNYPHPSLVNTNTDALQQLFTTNAWKKVAVLRKLSLAFIIKTFFKT